MSKLDFTVYWNMIYIVEWYHFINLQYKSDPILQVIELYHQIILNSRALANIAAMGFGVCHFLS
jgi:hypothetical protein